MGYNTQTSESQYTNQKSNTPTSVTIHKAEKQYIKQNHNTQTSGMNNMKGGRGRGDGWRGNINREIYTNICLKNQYREIIHQQKKMARWN